MLESFAYILWGLLNLCLFLTLGYYFFKYIRLIRDKVSGIAAIIFLFGVISILSNISKSEEPISNKINTYQVENNENWNRTAKTIHIKLNESNITKQQLSVNYQFNDKKTDYQILHYYSMHSGLSAGTKWTPLNINIQKNSANKINYQVIGNIYWNILGIKIYTQSKIFKGESYIN